MQVVTGSLDNIKFVEVWTRLPGSTEFGGTFQN